MLNLISAINFCKNTKNIQKSDYMDKFCLKHKLDLTLFAENGGYPPTQNRDIRSLFWLFSLMALQKLVISVGFCTFYVAFWAHGGSFQLKAHACVHQPVEDGVFWVD